MNELIKSDALNAITDAEINQQVATAKKFPRDIKKALEDILTYATIDKETAESCFYAIPRGNNTIVGGSVRLAEIILMCWGNIRVASRIIANDSRIITAQGIAFDFENNNSVSQEVHRKITDRNGNTFSEDMQIVSANAACAIAMRNVVFKLVPKIITGKIEDKIKDVIIGKAESFETIRKNAFEYFIAKGVTEKQILSVLGKTTIQDIDHNDVFILRGTATAIKDKEISIQEAFSTGHTGSGAKGTKKLHDSFGNREEESETNNTEKK